MYANSGYLTSPKEDYVDHTRPLLAASGGTYRMLTVERYENHYPVRQDYQLLYVADGRARFFFGGQERVVEAGHMVLYRPGEEQRYIYRAADRTQVYWLHFTGSEAASLLRYCALPGDAPVLYVGTLPVYARLFDRIIRELQAKQAGFEEMTELYLRQLFVLIHRQQTAPEEGRDLPEEMRQAQAYFSEHYNEAVSVRDYAVVHHMSTSWFIRSFKRYTGVTPMQFVLSLRMATAKDLLVHSQHSITGIAAIVGYDNPLYFSRLFRRHTGLSPREYRGQ